MNSKGKDSIFLSEDEHIELLLAEYIELDKIVKKGETEFEDLLVCYEVILKELEDKSNMISTHLMKTKLNEEDISVFNRILKAQ